MALKDGSSSPQYVVVSNTFINVVEDICDPLPRGSFGTHRRVRSDSALREVVSNDYEMQHRDAEANFSDAMQANSTVEFECVGLDGTGSNTAVPAQIYDQSEVEGERPHMGFTPGGCGEGPLPARSPWNDRGSNYITPTITEAGALTLAPYLEQLLAVNRQLLVENQLLKSNLQGGNCTDSNQPISDESHTMPNARSKAKASCKDVGKKSSKEEKQPVMIPVEERTTIMLRNLPNNYTREMVMSLLDERGFAGLYDFFYLPIDFNSRAALGYAFVNVVSPANVMPLWQAFDGFDDWIVPSKKVCKVSWSDPHQGLQGQIDRYRNSPVMHETVPDEYKPVLLQDGVRISFPDPSKNPRAPRVRRHGGYTSHWSAALRAP
eukprot:TRINITY_DN73358_c0_g1_i1.p1 TRINITY_DN73358_c0_g1~~TRINITY_DN73358_c0_g1_i1.p1  ORF type:complete len:398 (-),score=48.41 TRINITY_DN73358_c0_g1_i1:327-1460(-)